MSGRFYIIMHKVVQLSRNTYHEKTGVYMLYQQSNYNIALASDLLNHFSKKRTFRYLGLNQITGKIY